MIDGKWRNDRPRSPITSNYFQSTAWGIQGLSMYQLPARKHELEKRIQKGVNWLQENTPENNVERIYQLVGLAWAGLSPDDMHEYASKLIHKQQKDGGWYQRENMHTDAYATSLALFALHEAGIDATHTSYQKGVRWLVTNQLEDGTWFVRRRARYHQPTMQAHFPHGRDAWISSAATAWAIIALCQAVDPNEIKEVEFEIPIWKEPHYDKLLPPPVKQKVVFERDIRPVLDISCFGCHSGNEPKSGYSIESYKQLIGKGSQGYDNVIPGDSANSPLVHYVAGLMEDVEMPPPTVRGEWIPALTDDEIGLLRAWIDQGALTSHL